MLTCKRKHETLLTAQQQRLAMHVGDRLYRLRLQRGGGLRENAAGIGTTYARLCVMENGRAFPTSKMILKLAAWYGVPVAWFYEGFRL
jgi:transcriptional regulator with XRE-family HTH domain